jgi:hypothetical protein
LTLKKKGAIVVDGPSDTTEDPAALPLAAASTETPAGFFIFGYIAMKYLVIKAHKGKLKYYVSSYEKLSIMKLFSTSGEKDNYMVSYLIAKGASGLATTDIKSKSRKELAIENRTKAELIISKQNAAILYWTMRLIIVLF